MARTADVEHYPEGRDWRCPCGFSEPEDARPASTDCPECGHPFLARVSIRTVPRPKAEARRF